jgi:hypothetical protein
MSISPNDEVARPAMCVSESNQKPKDCRMYDIMCPRCSLNTQANVPRGVRTGDVGLEAATPSNPL